MNDLKWKKYPVLNDGFICLVDVMGDDAAIVQAARVSYGKDEREEELECVNIDCRSQHINYEGIRESTNRRMYRCVDCDSYFEKDNPFSDKDRQLLRYLLNHSHTTPFEMVEFKFLVRVPMDCWRQWIRHRTANVNEYSTRYTEAIDSQQTTPPGEWRLQATDNKQGSNGFLDNEIGETMSDIEKDFQQTSKEVYQFRLQHGVAKEQARKDLPLSTYTEAYWKCDLHNIFNFLRLRMDSHAQLEIRSYANAMAEIVKQVVPIAWEAFEDYVLYAKKFSRMEMKILKATFANINGNVETCSLQIKQEYFPELTDREWKEFLAKIS